MEVVSARVHALRLAAECGFELAGIASPEPVPDSAVYRDWVRSGMAGEMAYLTDYRADIRETPKRLLPTVQSILCVGRLYNTPEPYSTSFSDPEKGWISRYAWGQDYHRSMRKSLKRLATLLEEAVDTPFEWKVAVDTAPLLERSYARMAGLGWIGKNTCLINQRRGSWFFLGEILTSLEMTPDAPPEYRCGSCTRCIDACPTNAIVRTGRPEGPQWTLDGRLCISYFTIELRGTIPEQHRTGIGNHVFGCDICQDVCPWNRRASVTDDPAYAALHMAPPLEKMAELSEAEFRSMFRESPVSRAKYQGFLRNVAIAMGNSGVDKFREPLERLARSGDPVVAEHALWALDRLRARLETG